jgi:hypothetical protein
MQELTHPKGQTQGAGYGSDPPSDAVVGALDAVMAARCGRSGWI